VAWVRRSRIEFIAAILVHALWFYALIWGRLEADEVVIKSVVGWSVLGMIHVVYRRPELWIRAIPLFLLVQAAWSEGLTLAGILHSGSLIAFLVVLGLVFRWTSYLWIGVSLAAAAIASGSVQGIAGIARPRASLALLAAFLLLIIGGVVSWWKDRWLQKLSNATEPPDGTPREVRRN
jgi:hypothetical protein